MQSGKDITIKLNTEYLMPYIKVSSLEDAKELSKNLREADIEIKKRTVILIHITLLYRVKYFHLPFTIMNDDDRPIMIMGVIPQGKKA